MVTIFRVALFQKPSHEVEGKAVLVSELWDIYLALLAVLPRFQLHFGEEKRANDSGGGGKTV